MTPARAVAIVVLAAFAAFTVWVIEVYGLGGFFGWVFHNAATTQVFVDLCIALTLALLAITADARARGKASWPYWVLTVLTGSIGPLAYWAINAGTRDRGTGPGSSRDERVRAHSVIRAGGRRLPPIPGP